MDSKRIAILIAGVFTLAGLAIWGSRRTGATQPLPMSSREAATGSKGNDVPNGTYQVKGSLPETVWRNDGTKQVLRQVEVSENFAFRADGWLGFWRVTDGKVETVMDGGAWLVLGREIYFVIKSEGRPAALLGRHPIDIDATGLSLGEFAGRPISLAFDPRRLERASGVAAVFPRPAPAGASALQDLKAVVARISTPAHIGMNSREELEQAVRRAVDAKDAGALTRLSYPVRPRPEERLDRYLTFSWMILAQHTDEVRAYSQEEFEKAMKSLASSGHGFPAPIVAHGCFILSHVDGSNRSGVGVFFGSIDGQWALLGDPLVLTPAASARNASGDGALAK